MHVGGELMPDYERMYHLLFNAITNAVEHLKNGKAETACNVLICAQQEAEEVYIEAGE